MKALEINNLEKSYNKWKKVLKNINLNIEKWDFFSLLWINGAWKTTIIWILTDLVSKNSGEIKIFWIDFDKEKEKAKSMIWVVPQEFNLDIFQTVFSTLVLQAGFYGIPKKQAEERAIYLLETLDLIDKKDVKIIALSGWMKRRVMIARALMSDPKLLILDEPTAWIDINLRKSTWEYLKKINKEWTTILLTTHYLEEVEELCNRIAVITKGEIIASGTKEELFSTIKDFTYEIETSSKIEDIKNLNKFSAEIISENIVRVKILENDTLDEVLNVLKEKNLKIKSVEKKTNEIEELFIKLTKND